MFLEFSPHGKLNSDSVWIEFTSRFNTKRSTLYPTLLIDFFYIQFLLILSSTYSLQYSALYRIKNKKIILEFFNNKTKKIVSILDSADFYKSEIQFEIKKVVKKNLLHALSQAAASKNNKKMNKTIKVFECIYI